jgi:hypothetical protein
MSLALLRRALIVTSLGLLGACSALGDAEEAIQQVFALQPPAPGGATPETAPAESALAATAPMPRPDTASNAAPSSGIKSISRWNSHQCLVR